MKKTILYLVIPIFLATFSARSQSGTIGEIKADYVPFSNYVRPIDSLKTDSESNFKRIQMNLEVPISMKKDKNDRPRLWSVFLQGSYAQMENKNYALQLFPTELLNAQIGVKHMRAISPSWSLLVMASVGVYTDMEEINGDDILAQGGVLFIKQFNSNLAFGFGPVFTNSFGIPMVLPGIYFNWESQKALHFRVNFPEGLELGYRMSPNFDLKAVLELSGMTAETNVADKSMLLGYQQVITGIRPQLKLGKYWTLEPTVGSTIARSFSTDSRKIKDIFKEKDLANPKFTPTLYGALALKWKF
jgi:hypothetical protein